MKKIIFCFVIIMPYTIYSFVSPTKYSVSLKGGSLWGISLTQGTIKNNAGNAGTLIGTATTFKLCPSPLQGLAKDTPSGPYSTLCGALIDLSSVVTSQGQYFGSGKNGLDVSKYFSQSTFSLSLDLSQLVPTDTEKTLQAAW